MPVGRFIIVGLMLSAMLSAGAAGATSYGGCSVFNEDFSGLSIHTWTNKNGAWSMSGGVYNVSSITKDMMAYSETVFLPSDHFVLDVDVNPLVFGTDGDAFGILPRTTPGDLIFPQVNGITLEGLGAILFRSGNAYLTGWDAAGTWHNFAKYVTSGPVTSIGVQYAADAITLRINRQNTTSKVTGSFDLAYMLITRLRLFAQGPDTSIDFDNVCADPLGAAPSTPAPPANLRYSTSGSMMTIQWDASPGAAGYKLGVGFSSGNYAAVADLGNTTILGPFDISAVPAGTYYLAVRAYNAAGESAYSGEKAVLVTGAGPAAPTSLTYEIEGRMMTIRWNASGGAAGYRMGVGTQSGQYLGPVDLGSSLQLGPFNIGAVPAGIYYIAVKAYNGTGSSAYSKEIMINVGSTGMGVLTSNPVGADGSLSGSYKVNGSVSSVTYTARPLGGDKAQATFAIPGTSESLSVEVSSGSSASLVWKGVTIDGKGSLSAQESAALSEIMASGLAKSLALVPLEMGCRPGSDPAAVAALLVPFQTILKYGTSGLETAKGFGNATSCGYFPDPTRATDTRTAPTVVLLSDETPFPHVFGYFPFDEYGAAEAAADISFQSAFPTAQGSALGGCGSRCRGACGADCASLNCNKTSEWLCNVDDNGKNTGERTLWVYQDCGVEDGCIWHDDCFDACKKKYGCSSWLASNCMHNLYNGCDVMAASKYGYVNCASWAVGLGGPYSKRETFKFAEEVEDNPEKCPPGQSLIGHYRGSITGAASGVINLSVVTDTTVAGNVSGIYEGDAFHGTFSGSIDADGNINATVTGTVTWEWTDTDGNPQTSTFAFGGTLTGKILQNLTGSGSWFAADGSTKEIGQWTVHPG